MFREGSRDPRSAIDFDRFEETLNEKTKAVLIMENDRVVLSALLPEIVR